LGAIMDLGGWLRSLGLERYEAIFRENAIANAPHDMIRQEPVGTCNAVFGFLAGDKR